MISLEYTGETGPIQRNFERLAQQAIETGGQSLSVRVGTGAWTFTAASVSAETTVSHGLGRTPVLVGVFSAENQGASDVVAGDAYSYDDTTFKTKGAFTQGTLASEDSSFVWIAIG